jgi:hypothetical protein
VRWLKVSTDPAAALAGARLDEGEKNLVASLRRVDL